jgi:nucleotide-binding universal stress UspA family protein
MPRLPASQREGGTLDKGPVDIPPRRTVLVPLDGLPLAETALPFAELLALTLGADLDLLRVVPPNGSNAVDSSVQEYLGAVAQRTHKASGVVSTHVLRGDPAECIVREAAAAHVTLLVMTTHARAGVRRAVLGSVAEEVVAHAPAPTVLLRGCVSPQPRLRTVLVAIGGMCAAPLSSVTELARAAGARVVLLRVVTANEMLLWQWQWRPEGALDEPQAVTNARQELCDLASGMCAAGVATETRVRIGSIVPNIKEVAEEVDADLIVMTTHGRLGTQRTVQGSVSDAVVHSTRRPVLLCRLVPMPPQQARAIDLLHVMQHRQPILVPQSIGEPQYKNIGLPRTWRTRGK